MINPAPLHFYFFGGVFSLSFLLLIAATPLYTATWMSTGIFLCLFIGIILFSFFVCYQWVFVSKRPVKATMLEFATLLAALHPFAFGIHYWDPLTDHSKLIQTTHWWENINLVFGIGVLLITTAVAYAIAYSKSDKASLETYSNLEWSIFQIDLRTRKYGRRKNFPIIHTLYWPLILTGVFYISWFANQYAHTADLKEDLKLISLIGMCSMILCYLCGLVFGEGIRLIQIERYLNKGKFGIEGLEHLLRWRHDYVKYHLPTPIRKLNLRLFNQHVEAYERLQNKVKTSRT
ncbi:hypothetical protein [Limnobacter parvus]|uniref:Uncharacterized protein n=1 Tax=Limnobacter parvus TaxID=2939690 RepID=A0ABT1XGV6_9BURK|nr:hypothetical protein [Limnobacter parvus]MCR2746124.1 hypothetical protein [Limnobacter parvus]